jgi:LDH2 family malate/lactate/ureidoglycolate dehydrogenase
MPTVTPAQLQQWITAILHRSQVPEEEARLIAAVRGEAALRDALGFDAFAARSLANVVERLRAGGLNPRPQVRLVHTDGALAIIDGDGGLGQLVGVRAMAHCLQRVERHGMALVAVRRSSSLGALAYYPMLAIPRGCIGFAATNTELRIGMPPWGGVTPTLGNNPFAVAIPTGGARPIVLDMSLTATPPQGGEAPSMMHRQALLAGGNAVREVMGGHKGYGLAVVLEILCGVLTGAGFGRDHAHERIGRPESPPDLGHLFLAVDGNRLMLPAMFESRVGALIEQIKASEHAAGVERILLPGELEFERREARLRSGIPVSEEALKTMQAVADNLGLELNF